MAAMPMAAMPMAAMLTMPAEVERRHELVKMGRSQWK
jgi:hypothetical protein